MTVKKRSEKSDVDRIVEAFDRFNDVPMRKPVETTSPSRSCKARQEVQQ